MGTVPSLANSCGTSGDYYHNEKEDLFDIVDKYHYSIVKNSDDGGGRVSPIYISLPSLPAVVISASASTSSHFPRDEEKMNFHVHQTESHVNNAATLHVEHPPQPPSIPKRTYRSHNNMDNCSRGGSVPRDVSVKVADPISSSCSTSNFSAILFPHHTIGGDRWNAKTSFPFRSRQDEKSDRISRSRDQTYPAPSNSGHQKHNNPDHHQSQSQGFSSSSFQEEDCYYCCIDECTTFIDVNLLSEPIDEPFYSFLPFSSLSRRACSNTGITYCPTWSFPAPEPIAPLLPPRLARSSRAVVIGRSSFSKYLSDILEASVELSRSNSTSNIINMGLGDLSQDPVYTKLVAYWKENGSKLDMRDLFKNDPERFKKFRYGGMY